MPNPIFPTSMSREWITLEETMIPDQNTSAIGKLQTSPLRLENVTKRFGSVVAVERVSPEIPRGAFMTVLRVDVD